jgi:hypothetical protein
MRALSLSLLVLMAACDQPAPVADCVDCTGVRAEEDQGSEDLLDAPDSMCGNVWYVDMEVVGQLVGPDGTPVPDAEVWLEERAWMPTSVHGEGWTDAEGHFAFEVTGVPIVEDCWGWAALFHVVGERDDASGEIDVNMQIVRAWQDGSFVADVSNLDFVLER